MDLSVVIPARNEMFLARTIECVLENIRADTEIIVTCDGAWPAPPIEDHERVAMIYHPEPVGQRAATNDAAKIARGQYVMKLDAHCSVGEGFDAIMLEDIEPDMTMIPLMHNLHAFDWVCQECGKRKYQGPTPGGCPQCGGPMEREILWKAKPSPRSTAMRFDKDLRFKYWSGYKKRQRGDLVETMSILGACWMLSRERYFELNICDEEHGGWGQQGTEVACKTWLSGGRLIVTKKTWFAHMFRTQGGDFGFPYRLKGSDVNKARKYSRRLWRVDNPDEMPRWDKAIYSLSWLIERFAPVPDWHDEEEEKAHRKANQEARQKATSIAPVASDDAEEPTKAIVYYTDNRLDPAIMAACQAQLSKAGLPIVSASLEPLDFGQNVVVDGERGPLTMFRQILAALKASTADVIFFCEHDILYHPAHFEFTPERADLFYYNNNVWKVDAVEEPGRALFHYSNHTSQLCAHRKLLLEHYRKRVEIVKRDGFSRRMGFEPGTHRRKERVDDYKCATWMSPQPNIDIRHGQNLTPTRWERDQFRNRHFTKGWTIADAVAPWYEAGGFGALLDSLQGE
jgi:glycosyltransferase involved in cell wall biosynthesis